MTFAGPFPHDDGPAGRTLADLIDRRPDEQVRTTADTLPALRTFNVIGRFGDANAARHAILVLERDGTEGARISSISTETDSAGRRVEAPGSSRVPGADDADGRTDPEGVTGTAARRSLVGGVLGGVISAVVFVFGALLIGGTDIGVDGAVAAGVGGFAFGAAIGAILTAFSGFGTSQAWKGSYDTDALGRTYVGVHTDDPDEAGKAYVSLRDLAGDEVRVLDREGRNVPMDQGR
jgi:hypothetical protein